MVVTIAMFVHGNMSIFQPHLAPTDNGVRSSQIHLSFANGFNLGANQRDTCFNRSLNRVIMVSLPIGGNHLEWLPIRGSLFLDCCLFSHLRTPYMDVYLLSTKHCLLT